MRLIKCYVSSFGKLNDYTYQFDKGLNTIKEDNGFGKSTLATFIKAVFYGLNDSKRNVADNERTKFRPWNSVGKFGGYIEFEWGGQEFKIERFFGNKASEDSVKLYDLKTGRVHENPEDIGKRIFEIDEEGFLSTTYFSQKDFQVKSNTSLTAKFNSVCEIQDSETFDKALSKVEEKAKTYKYRGDKGLISETKNEIYNINDKIEECNKAVLTGKSIKIKVDALEKEIDELKEKLEKLNEKEKIINKAKLNAIKKENYNKIIKRVDLLNAEKDSLEQILNGNKTDEKEIDIYLTFVKEIENLTVSQQNCAKDIRQLEEIIATDKAQEQDRIAEQQKEVIQRKHNKTSLFLGCASGALIAVSIILSVLFGFVSVPAIVCMVLALATSIFTLFKALTLRFEKHQPVSIESKGDDSKKQDRYQEILQRKQQELIEYAEIKTQYETKVDSFISLFNLPKLQDRRTALDQLKKVVASYDLVLKNLQNTLEEKDAEFGSDMSFLSALPIDSIEKDTLEYEQKTLRALLEEKTNELNKNLANIRYYDQFIVSLPEYEEKKIQLAEKLAQYKDDYELLNLTADFLKKADENLKVKYRAPLQNSLNKYLQFIAGEQVDAKIDIDLSVTIQENGAEKVTEYYSKGYQNLFEICKRFALADVLFKGEKPFIVLDDPFYNLDDKKLKSAIELIKKLAEEYQIVYFVCHESRKG